MVQIIAEAGLNHNGDFERALALVDVAKQAGADVVKFQTSIAELEVTDTARFADGSRQLDVIRRLQLTDDQAEKLSLYCYGQGIEFMSTAADPVSLKMLVQRCAMKRIKIGSDNLTNPQFLLAAANEHKLPIILSTGMSTLAEVFGAVGFLISCGVTRDMITIMQCTSAYPAIISDANISAIHLLRDRLRCDVGFSDHTTGSDAAMLAVGAGATIIEKHFTLDNFLGGPDHLMSENPAGFDQFVKTIRYAEMIMGNGEKRPTGAERAWMPFIAKYLVAARDIDAGEEFSSDNVAIKRTGFGPGRPGWDYFAIAGKPASRAYKKDELIQ